MDQIQSTLLCAVFAIAILNLFLALWFGGNWLISVLFSDDEQNCRTCRKPHPGKLVWCQQCLQQDWPKGQDWCTEVVRHY